MEIAGSERMGEGKGDASDDGGAMEFLEMTGRWVYEEGRLWGKREMK